MQKSSEVSYLRDVSHSRTRKLPSPASIEAVCSVVTNGSQTLLQNMFDATDDSLFELANNARSNNEQNRFFETMREVRIKRRTVEDAFFANLRNLFEPTSVLDQAPRNLDTNSDQDTLSLVDNDDMEQKVAITSMASKLNANFQGHLLEIQSRFAFLYGATQPDEIHSPLEPTEFCRAFLGAMSCLEIELKEQLLILKQFDRFVASQIGELYDSTIKALDSVGAKFSKPSPKPQRSVTPPSRGIQGKESELLPTLQGLLEQQRRRQSNYIDQTASKNTQSRPVNTPTMSTQQDVTAQTRHDSTTQGQPGLTAIPTNELVTLLNSVQSQLLASILDRNSASLVDIRAAVQSQIDSNTTQIGELDQDLINLVAMLFEFILDDYNLAPSMQVLISRLQIPVLKVVLQDQSFFNSPRHPARTLLNSLAKAGIGWSEQQDKAKDPLYLQIQATVSRILEEYQGDSLLFEQLNREFNDFLIKEERRAAIVEKRTREAEEGRIRTKQAHKKVDETLSKQILSAHHSIPQIVIDTLKNGWSRVMFLAYLKDGEQHQWQNTVEVSKSLIWCLQPLTEAKDRQRWITIVPKLLKDLEAGLQNVSYNSANLKETIAAIKVELTDAFKESGYANNKRDKASKLLESSIRKAQAAEQDKTLDSSLKISQETMQALQSQINTLKEGQWVEFELIGGIKHRCKLSAHLSDADSFIFVNRMGLKPVERTRAELIEDLHHNKVVFLEQGLIIDRALSAITTSLRTSSSHTPNTP